MNLKEGMRRVGLTLGICGAIVGGFFAWIIVTPAWTEYQETRQFKNLLQTPTMQKVMKAVHESRKEESEQSGPWSKYQAHLSLKEPDRERLDQIVQKMTANKDTEISIRKVVEDFQRKYGMTATTITASHALQNGDFAGKTVLVELDGVKQVDVERSGEITSIELMDGKKLSRGSREISLLELLRMTLMPPAAGFLLPWALIKLLVWVVGGFFKN